MTKQSISRVSPVGPAVTVYGYSRCSTSEQAANHSLDAQRASIDAEAGRRGWTVTHVQDGGFSGSNLDRPGIGALLAKLRRGDVLVVARLDRLSRSLVDFAGLMAEAKQRGWSFVALDLGVDTTTPTGLLVANVMASVAEWERSVIAQRTKDGMAAAKLKGRLPGRRSRVPRPVQDRIVADHDAGMSHRKIAEQLNAEGVDTPSGRNDWTGSTVWSAARSARLERAAVNRWRP